MQAAPGAEHGLTVGPSGDGHAHAAWCPVPWKWNIRPAGGRPEVDPQVAASHKSAAHWHRPAAAAPVQPQPADAAAGEDASPRAGPAGSGPVRPARAAGTCPTAPPRPCPVVAAADLLPTARMRARGRAGRAPRSTVFDGACRSLGSTRPGTLLMCTGPAPRRCAGLAQRSARPTATDSPTSSLAARRRQGAA